TLYDEKVIGLGYTPMFLTHSDEALEIKNFKRSRENKIEFVYDYGNLNASYVNEKINFEDYYFQQIINPNFEKIDSPFQQTSSLKPYVPNVILEKIIIDLFESSENAISESENQYENDCLEVEKECDKDENPKVIVPGKFKLNLDTFSSVRRLKHRDVIWKKKESSNTFNADLSSVSHLKLNKDVKRYSRKDLMCDLLDDNNFFIFDDESVKISPVSEMPFRKKPRDSMNVRSKSNSNKSLPKTVHKWLPKMQHLAEPVAKWFPRFCGMKEIKREFSVAMTPQQNRVTERKNRTLIEAAKTILADSLLPIPFWVEVVNTACYVQNRVLVTKPHNKTRYELLLGRSPSIGFMRPFGCPVTILNTLDPIGKFDGKDDEGFLVGYSVNCKAFRVFNSRTRIVQEALHINFLENKPNVAGIRPKWLFDINTLTMSMNYDPVVAENQPNDNAGIKENLDAGKVRKETVFAQQYVLLPLLSTGSQDPHNTADDVADAAFDVKENENDVHVFGNGSDKTDNKKHDKKAKRDDNRKSPVDSPTGVRDLRAEFKEFSFNSTNRVNAVSATINAAEPNSTNSTNNFNTASPYVNTIMKSSTTNVETPINEKVFHEVFESFQEESSSSSLNDDVQHTPEE
nr:retrovirus-related Pol polyprotein from transposon TNT 1-94 [Tanacetum cinerariifolium]